MAVDDGSEDETGALLVDASRRDPRVRVIRTAPRGLVAALGAAIHDARAPLLARMDADDLARPERLALQAQVLDADPRVAVVGSRVRLFGDVPRGNGGMEAYVAWQNQLVDHAAMVSDIFVESPLVHPSVMMRREALRVLGGYRAFDGPEDYDLWLRAHEMGLGFAKCPEVLLDWRDSPTRLTRRDARYAQERFRRLKLEVLLRIHITRPRPVVIWGAGPIGKAWARDLVARGRDVRAFVEVDPRKIGRCLGGVPVVAVDEVPWQKDALHLAAVGQKGARERIRAAAAQGGRAVDLVAVA